MGQCKWSRLCEQPLVGKTYCDQHRLQHLARTKEWQARNKDKVSAWRKRYYDENPNLAAEQHRAYYEANREKLSQYNKSYRAAFRERNPEGYAKWDREMRRKHRAKDPLAYRLKAVVQKSNSRAKRLGREGVLTYEEIRAVYDGQKGLCFDCGATDDPPKRSLHLGHGVPLFYKAGRNVKDNIMFQCVWCNSKQHLNVHPKFGEGY